MRKGVGALLRSQKRRGATPAAWHEVLILKFVQRRCNRYSEFGRRYLGVNININNVIDITQIL